MRYIGGKSLMTERILSVIDENTDNVKTAVDLFSGSGIVAATFKHQNYKVTANDALYFSYVLNRGTLCINKAPAFKKLGIKNPIEYLNQLTIENAEFTLEDCFVYRHFSPNETCQRMYFQNENAVKIDIIRMTIEQWKDTERITEDEYYYLLAGLVSAVPFVSNITGVYAAYLKHWDARTYNTLTLKAPDIIASRKKHMAYHMDANELAGMIKSDLTYIDPPYNERQYLPNYHVLETIARYDRPALKGVTGMRDYADEKSAYCQKGRAAEAFNDLLGRLNTKYILISYNNEGLLSTEELTAIVKANGIENTFRLYEYDYRRYKNKIPNNASGLKEQLYFIRKK